VFVWCVVMLQMCMRLIFYNRRAGAGRGVTLIETLVAVAVFLVIGLSVYQAYLSISTMVRASRVKITATALANEQVEIIRNLPFEDVGISGGLPAGLLPSTQNLTRDGKTFLVALTVRNVDDPFDGTIGGAPNDLSPADYKLVGIDISCALCTNFQSLRFTTSVSPRSLETASTNGALFVQVIDAGGQPVPNANVHIENNVALPPIVIDDTTNNDGLLQIVDAPPGVNAYEITVSKTGYTSDQTDTPGAVANPNPIKPHATVALQQVTAISFAIDRASTLAVSSVSDTCSPISSADFSLAGTKLIGTAPNVLKYPDTVYTTNAGGQKTISALEWDTYNLTLIDAAYDLAGTIPLMPLALNPNATVNLKLVLVPKNPRSAAVTVRDAATGLPISDATARLEGPGVDVVYITGRGFLGQSDWSGGAGQAALLDPTEYFEDDGNVDTDSPTGEMRLGQVFGEYAAVGYLVSSTFDTGAPGNFHDISWQPQNQPPDTGANSVRFQIATNNNNATWNFSGPDGTPATFYTLGNQQLHASHDGDQYLRYKVYLQTASTTWTPNVSDVAFTFTSDCVPPGQVLFDGLNANTYTLTVSKAGYQVFSDDVLVNTPWRQYDVTLSP
jgi:hypothetical protein